MLMPDRDYNPALARAAIDTVLSRLDKDALAGCRSLHDFVWLLEPHFYPHDPAFLYDPRGVAARLRPTADPFADPVTYLLLPLVDASANTSDGGPDPLAACPLAQGTCADPAALAAAINLLYSRHYDALAALLAPPILE